MPDHYTKEQHELIRKLVSEGYSDSEVADQLTQMGRKSTRVSVYSYRAYYKIKSNYDARRNRNHNRPDPNTVRALERAERERAAKSMFEEGTPRERIAEILGVNRYTVDKYLRSSGVDIRRTFGLRSVANPFSTWKPTCLS